MPLIVDQIASTRSPDKVQVEFIRVLDDVEKAARAVELSIMPLAFADNLRKAF
ncbi:hypothetical protein [Dyadobacter sp. 3J3]|uniref:hypothetical protein n=1 Tax=Dyadobacter sp. 3J3 TaxID=2606600 RepID=UPI00135872BC|nr:hypothetical protein [Dyadobacter sp. 3J3]